SRLEHRRRQQRLNQQLARSFRVQVVEYLFQREAVLGTEREHDCFLVGSRLQFEAEAATEALAQRQPPGAIDATAERRVNHQLHAAALVEEALQNHTLLRR